MEEFINILLIALLVVVLDIIVWHMLGHDMSNFECGLALIVNMIFIKSIYKNHVK